jgi:sugar lactone lactonase YvrE
MIQMYGSMFTSGTSSHTINFTVAGSSTTPLVIDGCEYSNCYLTHRGTRTVAILNSEIGYQDTPGVTHTVFFEDDQIISLAGPPECSGNGPTFYSGTTVYGRQFDDELGSMNDTSCWKFTADGAKVWLLGYKTEQDSPTILTNGAQAEIFGFFFYQLHEDPEPENAATLYLVNSSLFATGYSQIGISGQPYGAPNWVTETQASSTESLASPSVIASQNLGMFYSYGAAVPNADSSGPYLLTASALPSAAGTVTVSPTSSDGEYAPGTIVTLTATASTGYAFTGWTGNVANSALAQTTVTMGSEQVVYANFVATSTGGANGTSFGSLAVGATSAVQALSYKFTAKTTLSSVSVLTLGATGYDYTDGGSSTCNPGQTYNSGSTCVENVTFDPSAPGIRPGAVVLYASGSTTPLKTFYLTGIGQTGIVTVDPGVSTSQASLGNGGRPASTVIDGAGNVYVSDAVNGEVIELAAGTDISSTIVASGLSNPTALALDGAGNLYIADTGNNRVVEVPNNSGTLTSSAMSVLSISGLGTPVGLAADGSGDLYVPDSVNNNVVEVPAGGGTPTEIATNLSAVQGIGLDSAGDVFVTHGGLVTKYPVGGKTPKQIGSGFVKPQGVAIDASGTIYVADPGSGSIFVVSQTGSSQTVLPIGTITSPTSVALDSAANVYATSGGAVYQVDRVQPAPLSFPATNVNATSAAQLLTFTDAGNQPLTLSSLTVTPNFVQEASGGTDCHGTTQLAAAGQCLVAVAFAPNTAGALTGSVALVDNALGAVRTQTSVLTGNGAQIPQTISFPGLASATYGGPALSLNATSTSGLPVTYSVIAGPATIVGNALAVTGAGNVTVQASQAGNTTYSAATSVTQNVTVNQAALVVTAVGGVSTYGQPIPPVTYTISGFVDGDTQASAVSGSPSLSTTATPASTPGSYPVSITQGSLSAANYAFSALVAGAITIQQASSTVSLAALNASIYSNQTTSLTATVSVGGSGGAPTQTVSFFLGSVNLGSAMLGPVDATDATATLSLSGSQLAIGNNSITAVYSGDPNYATSTALPTSISMAVPQASFPPTSVASSTAVQTLSYSFTSAATLTAVNILTDGASALDYSDGGGSTCTVGTSYTAGQTCVVDVVFTPTAPGTRSGAVTLFAQSSSLPLQNVYLNGVGQSASSTIDPGTQSVLETLSNNGQASAVVLDGAGNIYIADSVNNQVIMLAAGTFAPTTIVGSGLSGPSALAIDGAGNLYIADSGNKRVVVIPDEQGSLNANDLASITTSGLGSPASLAVDGSGNLYIADSTNGNVIQIPSAGGPSNTIASGLTGLNAVAVDSSGNIYVASSNMVNQYPAGGGTPTPFGTGFILPQSLAVDAAGDLYVSDTGAGHVVVVAPGGASQSSVSTGVGATASIALDAQANLYLASIASVYEVNRIQAAPLSFGSTNVTQNSSAQTLTVSNVGNQPLDVTSLAFSSGFGQMPGSNTSCSGGAQLSAGAQCSVQVDFTPAATGAVTGTFTLNDSALVATNTQTVQLSGSGTLIAQTITFPPVAAQTYGKGPVTLSASSTSGLPITYSVLSGPATVSGNSLAITATGSVTIEADQLGNADYSAASAVTQTFVVNAANQTITFITIPAQSYGGPAITLTATATSQLPVTFATTTPAICSVIGLTVSIGAAGNCSITASQAGNLNYSAATPVVQSFVISPAAQTITFAAIPAQTFGGSPVALNATANSQLPVSFAPTTPSVCSVSGSHVSIIAAGACTISASQSGNANYAAASVVNQSFVINPAVQTITFTQIPAQAFGGPPLLLAATSTSQLSVGFATATPAVCSVSGASLTTVSAGSCTVTASQAGNNNYSAAASVSQTFIVNTASQTITFATIPAQTFGGSPVLTATASSQLQVSFSVSTPAVCAVSGNTVSTLAAGNCTITASQYGNANYSAAPPVSQTFSVALASQTITFPVIPSQSVGATVTVSAFSSSQLPVAIASTTPTVCTLSGSMLTALSSGVCRLQASQAGSAQYKAATSLSQNIGVTQIGQSISFPSISSQMVGASVTLKATASSQLPVVYTDNTPTICSLSSSTLTTLAAGTCSVEASQAGNAEYKAATSVTNMFTVSLATQTISFGSVASQAVGITLSIPVTASSGLAVTLSSGTPLVCTASGTSVSTIAAGSCSVVATQTGNGEYAAAPSVTKSFSVSQVSQTISFSALSGQPVGATETLSATASSQLPVSFASETPSTCNVSGMTLSTTAAGTCTVQALQTGNAEYKAATAVTQSFAVSQVSQTITFNSLGAQSVGATVTLTPTASSGLAVTLSSSTPLVCTLGTGSITTIAAGTCSVTASQAGNTKYKAASSVTESFSVTQVSQTISFPSIAPQNVGATITLTPTATSGLAVALSSSTTSACTLSGDSVKTVGAGTCTIVASQTGNAEYKAASNVTQSFVVSQVSQSITFATISGQNVGAVLTLAPTSTSGLVVVLSDSTATICTLSGNILSTIAAGTCTITASQPGSAYYKSATNVTRSFTVSQVAQSINFATIPSQTVGAAVTLNATATSGLPVTLSATTHTTCVVSNGIAQSLAAGTCTIQATQTGDAEFKAASSISRSFTVAK